MNTILRAISVSLLLLWSAIAWSADKKVDPRSAQKSSCLSHGPTNVTKETLAGEWECFIYYTPRLFLVSINSDLRGKIVMVMGVPHSPLRHEFRMELAKVDKGTYR